MSRVIALVIISPSSSSTSRKTQVRGQVRWPIVLRHHLLAYVAVGLTRSRREARPYAITTDRGIQNFRVVKFHNLESLCSKSRRLSFAQDKVAHRRQMRLRLVRVTSLDIFLRIGDVKKVRCFCRTRRAKRGDGTRSGR